MIASYLEPSGLEPVTNRGRVWLFARLRVDRYTSLTIFSIFG